MRIVYPLYCMYCAWVDQRDKVCSYKKSIFANMLLFFFHGEFQLECVNNNEDISLTFTFTLKHVRSLYMYFHSLVSLPLSFHI